MRRPADWMRPADERILEYLDSDGPDLPSNMAKKIDFARKYIGERCRAMAKYDLVENRGGGLYDITEHGRAYLAGELDASTLDPTE